MRVLKHTIPTDKLLVQGTGKLIPVLLICFNTLWFFTPQKELYPTGRPFPHVLSAGWALVAPHYKDEPQGV